jgi:hypothetical protein
MSAAVFAYVALLRAGTSKSELLSLLPESRQLEIQALWDSSQDMKTEEIYQRLQKLRSEEIEQQQRAVEKRTGLHLSHLSPKLRAWLTRPF